MKDNTMAKKELNYALHVLVSMRNLTDKTMSTHVSVLNFGSEIDAATAFDRLVARYANYPNASAIITKLY